MESSKIKQKNVLMDRVSIEPFVFSTMKITKDTKNLVCAGMGVLCVSGVVVFRISAGYILLNRNVI